MKKYSINEELAGLDLHGLPCRVPKPVGAQVNCTHTQIEYAIEESENWRTGEIDREEKVYTVTCYEDIPGTNNIKCSRCGYTRRY